MAVAARAHPALRWDGRVLAILDQTLLPAREHWVELEGAADTTAAIRRLAVRGAPLIGIAAAYGLAMEVARRPGPGPLAEAAALLAGARPTAVNLGRAVERVRAAALAAEPAGMAAAARAEAERIHAEEDAASAAIAAHGADWLAGRRRLVTHCNAGALATAGYGTALGVIRGAAERGKRVAVFADETRPFLQGARLTAWELVRDGIETTVITESMAAPLMRDGRIDIVVVGADRIAANGDTANKVGTYTVALVAREHRVPFYVAAPVSTIDLDTPDGGRIPIEERDGREVTHVKNIRIAPEGAKVYNPAFDVTPHALIAGIITERGIARAPYSESLAAIVGRSLASST